jgi:hypothetical protein
MITIIPLRVIGEAHMHWTGCEIRTSSVTIDSSAVSRAQVCARLPQLGYEVTS